MNYVSLIVLAVVVVVALGVKYLVALLIARENVTTAKAKVIAEMFSFNPLDVFFRKKD